MIVKIVGVPYTLSLAEDARAVCHDRSGQDLYGQIDYVRRSIRLWNSGCPEQTLLHELLHGVIEHMKVRELMDADGRHLEIPIDQLAAGLAMALESVGVKLPMPSAAVSEPLIGYGLAGSQ